MANSVTALLDQAYQQLAAVSDSALLDAEVLLCHCLNKNRSFIRAWPEHQLTDQQAAEFQDLIAQRQQGVPIAYLTGEREFWSRSFKVNPDVLIPRPDSELLIELSLDLLPANQANKIIDLGTGSGILAITLAAERSTSQVIACDLSPAALRTAQANAQQLQIDNVSFLTSNWFSAITDRDFDLVISNPPYIDQHDPHLQQGDVRFEPDSALISPENGLQDIRLLADQARQHLKPGGYLLIEHGYDQQTAVQALFKRFNYQQITTHPDYAGNPRVTSGQWSPA
jgi:release factor glutamine methyltransferase